MIRQLIIISTIFTSFSLRAQVSIHIHLDKTVCYPGDTLWFRGFFFNGNKLSRFQTTLLVRDFNDSGRSTFLNRYPVDGPLSIGQFLAPKTPGLYWLKFNTLNSDTSKYISLTVRDTGDRVVLRRIIGYNNFHRTSNIDGIKFETSYQPSVGLWCIGSADSITPLNNKIILVRITYYRDSLWQSYATVHNGRGFITQIGKDSIPQFVNGFVTCRYYLDDSLLCEHQVLIPQKYIPPISLLKVKDTFLLQIPDSGKWNYSVSVLKSDIIPIAGDISRSLNFPNSSRIVDSIPFENLQFIATTDNKRAKPVKNRDIVVMFTKDTVTGATTIMRTDSLGMIKFAVSPFWGTASVKFMLNGSSEPIKLLPVAEEEKFAPPDSSFFTIDTLYRPHDSIETPAFDNTYLAPVTVTSSWQDRDKAIDKRFTTGAFSNPEMLHWNIMKEDLTYVADVWDFLKKKYMGLTYSGFSTDTPKYNGHYVTFYVNDVITNYAMIPTHMDNLAYIKIRTGYGFIEDDDYIRMVSNIPKDSMGFFGQNQDHTPVAAICIYTRDRPEDYRMNPTYLNTVSVSGYQMPLSWSKKDRTTLFWAPYVTDSVFKFQLPKSNSRSFKLIAEGINTYGQTFHFEKIIANDR